MKDRQFPIGKYKRVKNPNKHVFESWIDTISSFPNKIQTLVGGINKAELSKTYRIGSWNVKQLVHHLADSHMNAFIRFKLALTEEKPLIKPYFEAEWARLPDYQGDIGSSLKIIEGMHIRWTELLNGMSSKDYLKTYIHPEFNKEYDLTEALCQYDWHCRHHLAHIELALKN